MEFVLGKSALSRPLTPRPSSGSRQLRSTADWQPTVRAYKEELRRAVAAIEDRRVRERRR
jgi:hypothetical protein